MIISKEIYAAVVKITLQSMYNERNDINYNLLADTIHYYEECIKKENILSLTEFLSLCEEVEQENYIKHLTAQSV